MTPCTTASIGTWVEAHPATDAWMMGDRYGEIVKVGRKFVHVRMDRSGRTLRFSPHNLLLLPRDELHYTRGIGTGAVHVRTIV